MVIYRSKIIRLKCSLNRSYISYGELHCDSVTINSSLVFFQRQLESFDRSAQFLPVVIVFGLFCYCHSVIKSRATCRPKSRCQSDLSTVSVLANKSLHQDLIHSGYRGTAVPNVCLQAFSLFPLPTPLDQRPVQAPYFFGHTRLAILTRSCLVLQISFETGRISQTFY